MPGRGTALVSAPAALPAGFPRGLPVRLGVFVQFPRLWLLPIISFVMADLLLQLLKLEAVAAAGTAGYRLGPITLIYIALLAVKFLQLHARFSWSLSRADRLIETAAVRLPGPVALARVASRATCRTR